MNKLIKLSESHYIIVDDSEIKEGDLCIYKTGEIIQYLVKLNTDNLRKITHSTQPLSDECKYCTGACEECIDGTKPLSLSEVEEAINGYSVEKMAEKYACIEDKHEKYKCISDYREGFKAHQELVKDKLFTIKDMVNAFVSGTNSGANYESLIDYDSDNNEGAEEFSKNEFEEFKKSLLPKTEWEIEFDEQDKLRLI